MNRLLQLNLSFLLSVTAFGADSPRTIAFERGDNIYAANSDGKGIKKLAQGSLPEISPDGRRVAFNTDEAGDKLPVRHIAVVDATAGKIKVLKDVPSNNSFGPTWSPDGSQLLFSILTEGDWQLALINADGSGFRLVKKAISKDHSYYAPCWAADGKSFFCHDLDFIYRFDLSGKELKKWKIEDLTQHADMNSGSRISASPDGKSLIMDVDLAEPHDRKDWDGPQPALWLLSLDSGKCTRLTAKEVFAWSPAWINSDEFLCQIQGPKEKTPSLYRGSANGKPFRLIVKDARIPSASK